MNFLGSLNVTRVMIVDDHQIVRDMLARYLGRTRGIEVVGQAECGREAVDLCAQHDVDLVILDLRIPGDECTATICDLKALPVPPRILILTGAHDECSMRQCLQAGADGYLCKTSQGAVLIKSIRQLAAGGKFIPPRLVRELAWSTADQVPADHKSLSGREFEVFSLLSQGLTLTEISKQLDLSVKTISTYRSRILGKMHFRNNADIMRYSLRVGL
ncbi:MAG: response regulator transcription factor [Acidobacteriota bacterium]